MAITEPEQKARRELGEILEGLKKIDPESLDRTAVLGTELSFKAGVPFFQRTLLLFAELAECNLDNAPVETLNQLRDLAKQAWDGLQAIQTFSVSQHGANPASARDNLIQQLHNQWHGWYVHLTPHIAYSKARSTDYAQLEREARGTLSLMNEQVTTLKTEKEKGIAEIQGALQQVRRAAAEAGVAQHAIHFSSESRRFQTESYWWLGAALVFAASTVAYALFGLGHDLAKLSEAAPIGRVIQVLASRIVVLSVLTFGLVWTARNYAACRHNLVVNRHRQNALSTFETFAKAASDAQTKDAVLIQATQSIFCSQPSGFVKGDAETGGSNHVVEIVRGIAGGKE